MKLMDLWKLDQAKCISSVVVRKFCCEGYWGANELKETAYNARVKKKHHSY